MKKLFIFSLLIVYICSTSYTQISGPSLQNFLPQGNQSSSGPIKVLHRRYVYYPKQSYQYTRPVVEVKNIKSNSHNVELNKFVNDISSTFSNPNPSTWHFDNDELSKNIQGIMQKSFDRYSKPEVPLKNPQPMINKKGVYIPPTYKGYQRSTPPAPSSIKSYVPVPSPSQFIPRPPYKGQYRPQGPVHRLSISEDKNIINDISQRPALYSSKGISSKPVIKNPEPVVNKRFTYNLNTPLTVYNVKSSPWSKTTTSTGISSRPKSDVIVNNIGEDLIIINGKKYKLIK